MPEDDVLHVTALTPSTPVEPAPAPAAPPAAEPAGVAQPEEQPAASEQPQDATAQSPDAPSAETPEAPAATGEPPKKPSRGVQKALDRLTNEREAQRQRAEQAEAALAYVAQQIQAQRTAPAPQSEPEQKAPEEKDFSSWIEYNRALAKYEARGAARETTRQELGNFTRAIATQQQQNVANTQAASLTKKLNDSMTQAPERFPDWEEVVASDAQMPASLTYAVAISDDPALVLHHLHAHPEEHAKLLNMNANEQLYRIGAIVASAKPQNVMSKAPPPAKPLAGGRPTAGTVKWDDMTPAQHKAAIQQQGLTRGLK